MTDTKPRTPAHAHEPPPPGATRRAMPWTRALWVSLAAFGLWMLIDAPTLQHNAQTQIVGARRTVSIDVLGPIAAISRGLGLSHIVSVADGVIGRNGNQPGNGSGILTIGPNPRTAHRGKSKKKTTSSSTTVPSQTGGIHPSAVSPLRVLIIGDSLGLDLGGSLQNDLANTGVVTATLDGKESTGLTRPDYYNWPAELQSDLSRYTPQVVVIMVGANDPQDFPGPPDIPYTSPQWNPIYAQRVSDFAHLATSTGASLIWVGMPPMADPARSQQMQALDFVYAGVMAKVPNATFISSTNLIGSPQGQYTPYISQNGQEVNVREPDGIHIAPGGAEILSQSVLSMMRTHLHITLPG